MFSLVLIKVLLCFTECTVKECAPVLAISTAWPCLHIVGKLYM